MRVPGLLGVLGVLRSALLGETWTIPAGVAVLVGVAIAGRVALGAGETWHVLGAALLVVGALVVLATVSRPPAARR